MSTITRFTQLTAAVLCIAAMGIAKVQDKDIVQTLGTNDSTTTFVKLANEAGLTDTLKGAGPYTVLVPNDAAFDKLKASNPALYDKLSTDKPLLKKVLEYHTLNGATASTDLKDGSDLSTVEGEPIHVTVADQGAMLDKSAKIVSPDVKASNGTIHVIDTVLLPKTVRDANGVVQG